MDNRRITNHEPVPIAVKIHWIYGESGNNFRRTILVLVLSIPFERFHPVLAISPSAGFLSSSQRGERTRVSERTRSFGPIERCPFVTLTFVVKKTGGQKKERKKKKTSHKRQLQLPSPRESRRFFSLSPSSKRTSIPRTEISVLDWRVVEAIRKYHLPPSPSLEILLKFPLIILALAGEIDFNRLCTRPT